MAPKDGTVASRDRWLVVGLGNPGERYQRTLHNAGFWVTDALAEGERVLWKSASRFVARLASIELSREPLILVQPQTFMNKSGQSAAGVARYYRVPENRIIVIHDDIDLPLGEIRLKQGGGDGGHRGLRSIVEHFGTRDFIRIRLGVGRPEQGEVNEYVLRPISSSQAQTTEHLVQRGVQATQMVIREGLQKTMNYFHALKRG